MDSNLTSTDIICDLQGNPLHPDSVALVSALDKLLTVGSYYSSEHEQYLQAARKACHDIVGAIGGSGKSIAIEITAQGMMIGKQNLDPRHRNIRLLHGLLVPLNIARLEIIGSLTPDDLLQAISALQNHKQDLGQSNSFTEIVFDDLPATVKVVGCNVMQKEEDPLDQLFDNWANDATSGTSNTTEKESEQLARQFMEMVTSILENLEQLDSGQGINPVDDSTGAYASKEDLINLKIALQRLVEVNPDPADLANLITQAQRALDLSRDESSVNLVFSILKKDILEKHRGKAKDPKQKSAKIEYKLTVEELLGEVARLESDCARVVDPRAGSRANQLGMSFHLLRTDPPRPLRMTIVEILEQAVIHREFARKHLPLCAQAFDMIVREGGSQEIDNLLPVMTEVMREKRPEIIVRFWEQLLDLAGSDYLTELWPHLVNDILLGFPDAPREMIYKLVMAASGISVQEAMGQGRRFEKLPALQEQAVSRDLFIAPMDKMCPVFTLLQVSPLRDWLGAEVYRSLVQNPVSPLIKAVVAALDEHKPELTSFYLDMVCHSGQPEQPAEVKNLAVEILQGAIWGASLTQRKADWLPLGLVELAKLAPEMAHPLLDRIINERKFLFFKAWPPSVREAAANILAADLKEGR